MQDPRHISGCMNPKLSQDGGCFPLDFPWCEPLEWLPRLCQDSHVLLQVFVLAFPAPNVALAKVDEASPHEEGGAGLLLEVVPEVKAGYEVCDLLVDELILHAHATCFSMHELILQGW